ncbi:hypothetical protein [Hydrogenoanaerobacterium sp.]|uniref:hypothetical protein n=1 Tax=Hydrogenoanaerobacterium sp. TaxID=2953763 RepID=UPI0028A0FDB2|nr:hypothetical protein [Hydrogenoanaerobacterium sp.]
MLENGKEACNCKIKSCPRFGKCAECLEHHRLHKKHPPYCKRAGRVKPAAKPGRSGCTSGDGVPTPKPTKEKAKPAAKPCEENSIE